MTARRGIPFVLSAPSGTGKTTVCREVVKRDRGIVHSVSHTTRKPRPGERDGVDYNFVSPDEFRALIERGAFVEYALYGANLYGTSRPALEAPLAAGFDVLLEIETQGARQVRANVASARFVFLLPPSLGELRHRLEGRGTEDRDAITRRFAEAHREIEAAPEYDYCVVNDDVERCVRAVLEIVATERRGDPSEVAALRSRLEPRAAYSRLMAPTRPADPML